ncbi:OmpH family outer membrane protein [Jhaorihella thermophila]|uniref:Chaperone for outer membrane proteins, Skp family n=2 Tax=Jhaorihella thermophila TaxID=488547 RepID=A0A1H5SEQ6_9RHOB|nr:OmpH family outer membrane protein [Jhaorihella thermophila]SEF48894.1 chaperone for outer membrane proteins, Skp family [Jhaorihella thermophila]
MMVHPPGRIEEGGALFRALALFVLAAMALTVDNRPAPAQQLGLPNSAILTLSAERLFSESAFGRRVAKEIEAESAVLAAENRRIEAELSAEEKELTERRGKMAPDAFRTLADAFDAKVQEIRKTQDAKARDLVAKRDAARVQFLRAARPVLEALMRDAGATVILERSSVFLSANSTDVTDAAIERIDAILGDGSTLESPKGR